MIEKAEAEKWLKEDVPQITYFLDIRYPPKIVLKPNRILSRYDPWEDKISIGLRRMENRDDFRKMLVHEFLHKKGISHSRKARVLGYYAIKSKDTLSEKVRDWIFYGKPKPPELGVLLEEIES